MTHNQLRTKFLEFYKTKSHAVLPSASLIPKEDPTLLFVNSGMYPLVPYLMGETHPQGSRLTDLQKCIRTVDIDEVGDNRHLSFFEMFGTWSLGDYSKKESIEWGFEFLTDKESGLGLDPKRLFVTVYKGYQDIPEDSEAVQIWKDCFAKVGIVADSGEEFDFKSKKKILEKGESPNQSIQVKSVSSQKYIYRITKKSGADNWWGLPYRGPCGPCSEIYYLLDKNDLDIEKNFESWDLDRIEDFVENQIVEIWNHVFMEYEGQWQAEIDEPEMNLKPLAKRNIDTGGGFERLLGILQNKETVQETDLLRPIADVAVAWSS
jgi:alanyl-tRNA synthetase